MSQITVLGNFSIDRVDDRPPSPGGCPVFAMMALKSLRRDGRVIARMAPEDGWLFDAFLNNADEPAVGLAAETTSAFSLRYTGGRRVLTVDAISDPWTVADIEAAEINTNWVHIAPLLRGDFPSPVLAALSAAGHLISYDGQGLVRAPRRGSLQLDNKFDRTLLRWITVLKLNGEEAAALGGGEFGQAEAERLGVSEILVTFGAEGCDLYLAGRKAHIPARPITGVHTTGTGDAFMVAYLSDRAEGTLPAAAAENASSVVADLLEKRRMIEGSEQSLARP